jgi:hypothetical protein
MIFTSSRVKQKTVYLVHIQLEASPGRISAARKGRGQGRYE